jgi:hypothetical protein
MTRHLDRAGGVAEPVQPTVIAAEILDAHRPNELGLCTACYDSLGRLVSTPCPWEQWAEAILSPSTVLVRKTPQNSPAVLLPYSPG